MTGDFPELPGATLSTATGVIPLETARRDHTEIWLTLTQLPETAAAILRLQDSGGTLSFILRVIPGAPGIFTFDGSGSGAPAGYITRPDGSRQFLSTPIRLDSARDAILDVYANSTQLPNLAATLGGRPIEILSASPEAVRLRIPAGFPLRGDLDLLLRSGSLSSNSVRLRVE
jgi:hypothetical protein